MGKSKKNDRHPKEIILISSHIDNQEKVRNIINLISEIKSNDYKICLLSHCDISNDIIKRADYYIYDRYNIIDTVRDNQSWRFFTSESFEIDIKPPDAGTHYIAYYRLIFGGLSYLSSMDYDIVHVIDYDIIFKSFIELKNNKDILTNGYDIVNYLYTTRSRIKRPITNIFSVNMTNLNLTYDESTLIDRYTYYMKNNIKNPPLEHIMFEYLPKKVYNKDINDLDSTVIINTEKYRKAGIGDSLFTFFIKDDTIYFFFKNWLHNNINLKILFNGRVKEYIIGPKIWEVHKVDHVSNVRNLSCYIDDTLYIVYDNINENIVSDIKKYAKLRRMDF